MRPQRRRKPRPPSARRSLRAGASSSSLAVTADEWASLTQAQSRLAHAAALLEAAASGEEELTEATTRSRAGLHR